MEWKKTARWQKARARFLRDNPLCVDCYKRDRLTPATVVDHIKPHKGDYGLFWDESNWQGMCKPCHDRKTASEDGGFGNTQANSRVRSDCGLDGLPVDSRHHWNKGE